MATSTQLCRLSQCLAIVAGLLGVCPGRVSAADFTYKGALQFTFSSTFHCVWDDAYSGTNCARVSFWYPDCPAGYWMLGNFVHGGRDDPSGSTIMVLVKELTTGALADPIDYEYQWWDRKGRCNIWKPIAPEGYVAMGTVVVQTSNKPFGCGIKCVRKDLVVEGVVGDPIWNDKDSRATNDCSLWQVGSTTPAPGICNFSPNSFLCVSTHEKPLSHSCAYQFQIKVPIQGAENLNVATPQLTSKDKPADYATEQAKSSCLVPWFAVLDNNMSIADKPTKSPYYKLERTDRYRRVAFLNNNSTINQSDSQSYTTGFSQATADSYSNTLGVKTTIGSKAGDAKLGEEFSVSVEFNTSWTWGTTHTDTTTQSTTQTVNIAAEPGTAVAAYAIESTYRLYRNSGDGNEVVNDLKPLSGISSNYVYVSFPPGASKRPAQVPDDHPVLALDRYVGPTLTFTRRLVAGGSEWVMVDNTTASTLVLTEISRDTDLIYIKRPLLQFALPIDGGKLLYRYKDHQTWEVYEEVKLAK